MIYASKPKFITFEGGEGSGKSTQSKLLHEYLLSRNIKSIHTREIGGTIEAEKIRDLVVYSELFPVSELMLVMAARYEHINKVIIPALQSGSWVICDRFVDSTACYQSGDSGLSLDDIYELHDKLMTDSKSKVALMPDLTFFMDVPPEIGLKRAGDRGDVNKFEAKNVAFHQVIYDRFQSIAKRDKGRFLSIEAVGKTIDEIHQDAVSHLFG
ncbi:MAG: dTMP kinase [Rickettsiaceae bacterium]|nr:dTMP kinase [Rickettsiaceae bacterium]